MKNKKTLFMTVTFLALGALVGCKKLPPSPPVPSDDTSGGESNEVPDVTERTEIKFWTGFGQAVNNVLEPLIERFESQNPNIKVDYETKGGYPALTTAIKQSVSNREYPHIANGYPDHFADYANSSVLLNLDSNNYIKNANHGVDIERYYDDYMVENRTIIDGYTVGLPFNKSTEILVANQSFFDVANKKDPSIKVPTTWQELAVIGPKLRQVAVDNGWFGKLVKHDGTTMAKPLDPTEESLRDTAFDMTNISNADDFIPFNWDSNSNFFITILRQWGSVYTERGYDFHTGYIRFQEPANKPQTIAALQYMQDLRNQNIIAIPETFGEGLYGSKPFREGKTVLTVSSSAGIAQNIPVANEYKFDVSVNPILYNADKPELKSVISQGTNLALFTKGDARTEQGKNERLAAWKLLRFLTYEVNHEFGKGTSYFPVTDGSKLNEGEEGYEDYVLYRDFLDSDGGTLTEEAIRNTAITNHNVYMAEAENWTKFVDPAFSGSTEIRAEIENAIRYLFEGDTPEEVIAALVKDLPSYVQK